MKKNVYRVRTQYIFEGVFDVVAESKEGSTAESPATLWVGYAWKHSQHFAR